MMGFRQSSFTAKDSPRSCSVGSHMPLGRSCSGVRLSSQALLLVGPSGGFGTLRFPVLTQIAKCRHRGEKLRVFELGVLTGAALRRGDRLARERHFPGSFSRSITIGATAEQNMRINDADRDRQLVWRLLHCVG